MLRNKFKSQRIATEEQENFTMALWREVFGYEGRYLVSDEGEIFSLPKTKKSYGDIEYITKGKILKPGLRGRDGLMYEFVSLVNKDGVEKHESVHRLVASAFVENPNGYGVVNHIDHNTLNNKAENLEWCDQQYNNEYGHNKPVSQFTRDGELIATYKSATHASLITGIGRTSINNALNGWSRTAGGFMWKFSEQERGEDLSH